MSLPKTKVTKTNFEIELKPLSEARQNDILKKINGIAPVEKEFTRNQWYKDFIYND